MVFPKTDNLLLTIKNSFEKLDRDYNKLFSIH